MTARAKTTFIWIVFGILTVLATAPVWRVLAYGVNPTLDQALLFICGGER